MTNTDIHNLSDAELKEEAKKLKSFSIQNSLLIGFLMGIIFYSVTKNSWGLVTLIPLYFIYKLINDPKSKRAKEIDDILRERSVKAKI
ncbi:inner membrane protein involved in colicin E2 resistance [Flavobacterium sp. 7E]|uniref:FUSC family protein n=1 Tax=unclassified Flavobacterium TaxID=196869 RepID=UPI00156E69FA|nr:MULTISPECIES: FUSC family protein [unclassified Flavobacterium]MBE0391594.1 hypothetical protein [Flavobacterium sp. PL002]NRS88517.1 inner membrane protein involved in colicin E2 resistance [Flavobacterium sp. 7E]